MARPAKCPGRGPEDRASFCCQPLALTFQEACPGQQGALGQEGRHAQGFKSAKPEHQGVAADPAQAWGIGAALGVRQMGEPPAESAGGPLLQAQQIGDPPLLLSDPQAIPGGGLAPAASAAGASMGAVADRPALAAAPTLSKGLPEHPAASGAAWAEQDQGLASLAAVAAAYGGPVQFQRRPIWQHRGDITRLHLGSDGAGRDSGAVLSAGAIHDAITPRRPAPLQRPTALAAHPPAVQAAPRASSGSRPA